MRLRAVGQRGDRLRAADGEDARRRRPDAPRQAPADFLHAVRGRHRPSRFRSRPPRCAGIAFISTDDGYAALPPGHIDADAVQRRDFLAQHACRRLRCMRPRFAAAVARGKRGRAPPPSPVRRAASRRQRVRAPPAIRRSEFPARRRCLPARDRSASCTRARPRRRALRTSARIAATAASIASSCSRRTRAARAVPSGIRGAGIDPANSMHRCRSAWRQRASNASSIGCSAARLSFSAA